MSITRSMIARTQIALHRAVLVERWLPPLLPSGGSLRCEARWREVVGSNPTGGSTSVTLDTGTGDCRRRSEGGGGSQARVAGDV